MTKNITWLGKYVGFILLFFVIPPYLMPRYIHVQRDIVIPESADKIYPQVSDLRRQVSLADWSFNLPYVKYDYSGQPSQVGSKFTFKSEVFGIEGEQVITEAVKNKKVTYEVNMGASKAFGLIELTPINDDKTLVKWAYQEDLGYNPVTRWSAWIREGVLSRFYDKGLKRLKSDVSPDV